jgi:hypothetical protein
LAHPEFKSVHRHYGTTIVCGAVPGPAPHELTATTLTVYDPGATDAYEATQYIVKVSDPSGLAERGQDNIEGASEAESLLGSWRFEAELR